MNELFYNLVVSVVVVKIKENTREKRRKVHARVTEEPKADNEHLKQAKYCSALATTTVIYK